MSNAFVYSSNIAGCSAYVSLEKSQILTRDTKNIFEATVHLG